MLGHRAQHLVVRRRVAEAEGGVLRLAAPHDVDRPYAENLRDPAQLVDGQRIVEILPDRQLGAGVGDELQRSAALAAAGVSRKKSGTGEGYIHERRSAARRARRLQRRRRGAKPSDEVNAIKFTRKRPERQLICPH
jgi:hypothetical protein